MNDPTRAVSRAVSRAVRSAVALAAVLTAAAGAPAVGQGPAVEVARFREVLGYLASDRLGGRDTPSPGLEEAAQFLAWSFAKAGLSPGARVDNAPDWFHRYTLEGLAFATDGASLAVAVDGRVTALRSGIDFRVWEAGRAFEADDLPLGAVQGADADQPRDRRRAMAGRTARLLLVGDDDAAWRAAAGGRTIIRRRAAGAAPVVLIRKAAVPAGAGTATLRVPAPRDVAVPLRNVVGVLRGTDLADEYVLVTAHYDHVGVEPRADGGDGIFNGADDDATGTTAVLCLAEHFAARTVRTRRSLVFVCFSAEEKGLRGSTAFVADPPLPLERIAAVVNLEMLGRPEREAPPFAWITGAELSDFAAVAGAALETAGVGLVDFPQAPRLFFASDNLPFARAGVVAHSISAGTLHRDYHKPGDEADRIDHEHATAVVNGLARVIEAFADRDERPSFTEDAKRRLASGR